MMGNDWIVIFAPFFGILILFFFWWSLRQKVSIEQFIRKLETEDREGRQKAVKHFVWAVKYVGPGENDNILQYQGEVMLAFCHALRDRDWQVRKEAVIALRDPLVRRAMRKIYRYSQPPDCLIDALHDTSEHVRKEAAISVSKIPAPQNIEPLLHTLQDESGVVRRAAAIALANIPDIRVIKPLLEALGQDAFVQRGNLSALKRPCTLVHEVVFGNNPINPPNQEHTLCNLDVSHLTVPMSRLKRIIIATETYDFYQVERFVTYAVNYIGQRYLKKKVEAHIYGKPEQLQPNLWNTLQNLCKSVHVYENQAFNKLHDQSEQVRKEDALSLSNMPAPQNGEPLIKDESAFVRRAALVHEVVFGKHPTNMPDPEHTLCNPEVDHLTVPMSRLQRIVIATATYDFYQVERFITYAVNYIGRQHLKKTVEVYIYDNPEQLHPNLWNTLQNLCKSIQVVF